MAGVWGCPPDTRSTPSWPGRGQGDARKGLFGNLQGNDPLTGCGKRGVQRGRAPLAGVWGCPPDTRSTPSWPGRGQGDARKGLFGNLQGNDPLTGCGKRGVQRGRAPLAGGLGVSPRYKIHPFLARKGSGRCSKRAFRQPARERPSKRTAWTVA